MFKSLKNNSWLLLALILWNSLDIFIHVLIGRAEILRISGNLIAILAVSIVLLNLAKKYSSILLSISAFVIFVLNAFHVSIHDFAGPMLVFIGVAIYLMFRSAQLLLPDKKDGKWYSKWWISIVSSIVLVSLTIVSGFIFFRLDIVGQTFDGRLEYADYWSDKPMILSAGMGFDNIIGVNEISEYEAKKSMSTWYGSVSCTNGEEPGDSDKTSMVLRSNIESFSKGFADYDDGLPVVFSWPVATETVDVTDFEFTLNTGDKVFANSVTMIPNWELNERNVVVLFGDFGNRGLSTEVDAIFPVKLEIVKDDTELLLIGPNNSEFNAVGLTWETDQSPYDEGPKLVGAKLNTIEHEVKGEGGVGILSNRIGFPNDELSLYDEGDFKIRVLTTGGFSPDGLTSLRPNMYQDFFRIHVSGEQGETVLLEKVGVDYKVKGGNLRVVGLSDLGVKEDMDSGVYYDDCYSEDRDNYIDIVLVGDRIAAENITYVEIPSLEGGYKAFYNPGGPGPEPFDGVRYTAPGPYDLEPVINDLDNLMRVSRSKQY